MKKVFCGIPVLVMTFVILLSHPLKAEASEMNFPGVPFNSNMEFKEVVTDPDYELSDFVSREQTWHVNFVDSLADVHVVMLESERTDDNGNTTKYHTYMFYSTDKFHLQEGWSQINYNKTDGSYKESPANMYDKISSKNSGSGMYCYQVTSQCSFSKDEDIISKSGIPCYRVPSPPLDDSTRAEILTAIANGTFDEKYEFVEGSDVPEYDPDNADYVENIGYLQDFSVKGILHNQDKKNLYIDYRGAWSQYTDTKFDVTHDNVYVSFYYQVHGTYKFDLSKEKETITAPRRFIKRVQGSDLFIESSTRELDNVTIEDRELFPYDKALYSITREDYAWFRIEVLNDDGSWSYGGWLRYNMKTTEASTYVPGDDVNGSDDSHDNNGGYGDGTEIKPETGVSGSEDNDWDNTINHDDDVFSGSFDVADFPLLLKSLIDSVGEVPELFGKMFSFLPEFLITSLITMFAIILVLRVLGR